MRWIRAPARPSAPPPAAAGHIALRSPCCAQARGGRSWPPVRRMRRTPVPGGVSYRFMTGVDGGATCRSGAGLCAAAPDRLDLDREIPPADVGLQVEHRRAGADRFRELRADHGQIPRVADVDLVRKGLQRKLPAERRASGFLEQRLDVAQRLAGLLER